MVNPRAAAEAQQPPPLPEGANTHGNGLKDLLSNMPIDKNCIVTHAPEEPFRLTFIDVTCLLVNRAIGTGIFNGPKQVMSAVRSPGVAVVLWVCGCIYAFAGAHVFLEYGLNVPRYIINGVEQSVPRSGGELHYLQYVFSWPRYKKGTILMSGVMFSITFICVGNMASNCIDCALRLVQLANPSLRSETSIGTHNEGIIRGIAIVIATVTCFIHAFSRRGGILLNNFLAVVKMLFLVVIILSTWVVAGGWSGIQGLRNATEDNKVAETRTEAAGNHAQAFLFVIFAFFGFDQPSYVLGEIKHPRKNFPRAMWWGMSIVSVLYVAVNICYMIVVPAEMQINGENVAETFFQIVLNSKAQAKTTFDAFSAISSFGNVVVWTYTAARMKQEIAKQGFIPFARFFASNKDVSLGRLLDWFQRATQTSSQSRVWFLNPENHREQTPVGALSLHLISCIVLIVATVNVSSYDSYNILSTMFSYLIAACFGSVLAIGILILHFRGPPASQATEVPNHNADTAAEPDRQSWREITKGSVNPNLGVACAIVYLAGSLYPIIASWIPPPKSAMSGSVKWYVVPLGSLCILIFSAMWFLGFIAIAAYRGHAGRKEFIYVCEPEFDWADRRRPARGDFNDAGENDAAFRMRNGGLILTGETIYQVWRAKEFEDLGKRHRSNTYEIGPLGQTTDPEANADHGHHDRQRPSGAGFANTDFASSRRNRARAEPTEYIPPSNFAHHDDQISPLSR